MKNVILAICAALVLSAFNSQGQYSIEPASAPATTHPIDKKYEGKLGFEGSNREMEVNIAAAEADWRDEMNQRLQFLLDCLPKPLKLFRTDS